VDGTVPVFAAEEDAKKQAAAADQAKIDSSKKHIPPVLKGRGILSSRAGLSGRA